MYPIPSTEKLVETKVCRHCQTSFPITDKDLEFYDKVSPTFSEKKYSIPSPTLCPDCRQRRRLSFRNERKFYKRKCDATGKDIVSIYSPDKPYKVYDNTEWFSDLWNPMSYGKDITLSWSILEQYGDLLRKFPLQKNFNDSSNVNSEYGNHTGEMKDCYLTSAAWASVNTHYSARAGSTKDSMDSLWTDEVTNSYQNIGTTRCDQCFYVKNCSDNHHLMGCIDCVGCHDCILCSGLNNKSYCIENIQYSKEGFLELKEGLYRKIKMEGWGAVRAVELKRINCGLYMTNCEGCVGDNISNCKDSYYVFDLSGLERGRYSQLSALRASDIYDASGFGYNMDKGYELVDVGANGFFNCFCLTCHGNSEIFYCINCHHSSHLFLCIGLRNKSYCILNKQYTKEQYEELVPRIIEHMIKTGEWWEFFPSNLSPFGYNETVAQEYYPLTKEQATKDDIFNWSDYEPPFPKVEKIIPASKLPQDITQIPDDILNWAIECEVTKKPFRIIKQELEFYRKHNLPIPKRHPDQRHLDRMAQRNPRKLFERKCDCCHKDMITTYAPERPERVYCEECYNREVIG